MGDKTPTQMLIEALAMDITDALREDDLLSQDAIDAGYDIDACIRTALTAKLADCVVAVYTLDDFTDRFAIVTGDEPTAFDGFPVERRMQMLNDVVHGRGMAESFEHYMDDAIMTALGV